jgi:uncharacterized protein (TIGR03083 family)
VVVDDVVPALDAEFGRVLAVLGELDEEVFARPTNCPPWSLKELVVHIAGTARLPTKWREGTGEPRSAADYYRRPERASDEYRQANVERVQTAASRYRSGGEAVAEVERTRNQARQRLQGEDLSLVIDTGVGPMVIRDYVATRVLAVAAHALDVAITLDLPWATSERALAVCNPIFCDLLGAVPPSALGWDAMDFFERATGRRSLTADDTRVLGASASHFPLVS